MPTQTRVEQGHAVVTVAGRLILGREVEQLENAVNEQLRLGNKRVVLDLAPLDYIDSSGIGTVVACLTNVRRAGGELRIAGLNARLERTFKMTGVDRLLSMYPNAADAVAS